MKNDEILTKLHEGIKRAQVAHIEATYEYNIALGEWNNAAFGVDDIEVECAAWKAYDEACTVLNRATNELYQANSRMRGYKNTI